MTKEENKEEKCVKIWGRTSSSCLFGNDNSSFAGDQFIRAAMSS